MNFSPSYIISQKYSSSPANKIIFVKLLFLMLLLFWCAGFLFPVLIPAFEGKPVVSAILSRNYSLVCHQSDSVSIFIGDSHLLVCARCAGIYIGAIVITIILLFGQLKIKHNLKPLIIFSAPLLVDTIAVRIGTYHYSKTIAFITGLLCGAVVIIYILDTIENSFHLLKKNNYDS